MQVGPHLIGDNMGQRGLTQARRSKKQDVIEGLATRLCGRGSRNAATFTLAGKNVQDAAEQLMETLAEEAAPHEASGEGGPVAVRIGGQPIARRRRAVGG